VFDVTPYAKACAYFLLGHPDCQDFGRKFKISFSGCSDKPCALARIHDIGCIAATRVEQDRLRRGFEVYVGGGLGPVSYQAKLFTEFLPVEELLPTAQAIARIFARLGEKKNRNRARLKFLVEKLGIEEFRRLVAEERAALPPDPAWTSYLPDAERFAEKPSRPPSQLVRIDSGNGAGMSRWLATNVYRQRQPGYVTVTIRLPLGDITAHQLRKLADVARRYTPEAVRTTVEQNIVLRWVSEADLPALYEHLKQANLAAPGAGTIADITACPGTDTCKLGISSSRGLARELERRFEQAGETLDDAARGLRIKISGCFNSCGQHHVADLGFYGVSRNKYNYTVPHFQVVLGGQWSENGGAYGLTVAAVPSKRIPEAVERITKKFLAERNNGETFQQYVKRTGKAALKQVLEDLTEVPPHDVDASFYTDWGDAREFTTEDIGVGECAGEVVSSADFQLAAAESELFEAQLLLERGEVQSAVKLALEAMLHGARALLNLPQNAAVENQFLVDEFRRQFYDTQLFFDPFVGGTFANHFFRAWESRNEPVTADGVRRLVSEAQLFLDACHSCRGRLAAGAGKR
ncbi:MAG: nitrite/sulfite reductase, partial [Bryobacteraceae bacterium]